MNIYIFFYQISYKDASSVFGLAEIYRDSPFECLADIKNTQENIKKSLLSQEPKLLIDSVMITNIIKFPY